MCSMVSLKNTKEESATVARGPHIQWLQLHIYRYSDLPVCPEPLHTAVSRYILDRKQNHPEIALLQEKKKNNIKGSRNCSYQQTHKHSEA